MIWVAYAVFGLIAGVIFLRNSVKFRESIVLGDEDDDFATKMLTWLLVGCLALLAAWFWPIILLGRLAMLGVKK